MLGTRTRLELHNAVRQHQDARRTLHRAQRQYRLNDVEPSEHDGPEDDGYNSGWALVAPLAWACGLMIVSWLVLR